MELIIASVLFIALMACWILLPGSPESAPAPVSGAAEPAASKAMRA